MSDTDSDLQTSDESVVEYTGIIRRLADLTKYLPAQVRLDREGQVIRKQRAKTHRKEQRHRERTLRHKHRLHVRRVKLQEKRKRAVLARREALEKKREEREQLAFERRLKLTQGGQGNSDEDEELAALHADMLETQLDDDSSIDTQGPVMENDSTMINYVANMTKSLPYPLRMDSATRRARRRRLRQKNRDRKASLQRKKEREHRYRERRAAQLARRALKKDAFEKARNERRQSRQIEYDAAVAAGKDPHKMKIDVDDPLDVFSDSESSILMSDHTVRELKGVKGFIADSLRFLPASMRIDREGRILYRERRRKQKALKKMEEKKRCDEEKRLARKALKVEQKELRRLHKVNRR